MQLTERHIVRGSEALEAICFKAARLYNYVLYTMRQEHFGYTPVTNMSEYAMTGLLAKEGQRDYKALPAQTAQQVIKLLYKNWKAYYAASKAYLKKPDAFKGKPKPPHYKSKTGYGICTFTNQQVRVCEGYLYFPKATGIPPQRTNVTSKIAQVRIVPQTTCFVIEIIYKAKQVISDVDKSKFLAIDLGVGNFATCINNAGINPFIVNGGALKSKNQWFNKHRALLMSYIGNKGSSNRIAKLTHRRNNYVEDKLHKISRCIIDYCIDHRIGTIVIGKNPLWKQEVNNGKRNNQTFVILPHAKLIDKITYKAALVGIDVITTEEGYTSKCDHLAYEPMRHHDTYLGKRKKRGLFQSSIGKLLNADINGAIGIARKVFGDSVVRQIADSGLAFNPVRINIV